MEINDRITLGIFAGIAANIIRNIVGGISYYLGVQDFHIWQFAASAYLSIEEAKTYGIIIGSFTDYILAATIGVFAMYFLLYEGFTNYLLKGLFIGGFAWLFIFTITTKTGISKLNSNSVGGTLSFLFNHLLLGILIVIFLRKFGGNIF